MNNFSFQNPTKLIMGKGEIAQLSKLLDPSKKILLTYGGGSIKANGVYDQVKEALVGFDYIEFSGIEANPQYSTMMKAVEIARAEGVEFLLAVGGGSVLDGTKFVATAVNYDKTPDPWDFLVNSALYEGVPSLPVACVMTLPATGSEMNCGAVISRAERDEKLAFLNPDNYPVFSILDPEVCYSLPTRQRANGIADTYCHTLEQYLTYPSESRVQDRFAEGILHTLQEIAPSALSGDDYDTMANFMYSSTFALNGIIGMGVPQDWTTHMIGHELTALYGLDHAVTLAIVEPAVLSVMRKEKEEKILQYGERLWGITEGSVEERVDATIAALRSFYESLGIKTRLSDHGVGDENFAVIAERFRSRGWNLGERGLVTPEKTVEILQAAL